MNRRSAKVSQNWHAFGEYLRNVPLPEPKIIHSWN
jgi:hypothetical protein